MLCCLESGRPVKLRYGGGKPRLAFVRRPQRVLYDYFLDPEFGRVYVRIETWFPYTVQIYVNGHDWLAQQLARKRAAFVQHDNCFTDLCSCSLSSFRADRRRSVSSGPITITIKKSSTSPARLRAGQAPLGVL